MIQPREVRLVVERGDLIEDYPDHARGHSRSLCGDRNGWPLVAESARAPGGHSRSLCGDRNGRRRAHVVCSPKDHFLAVITAYLPSDAHWADDGRTRRFP